MLRFYGVGGAPNWPYFIPRWYALKLLDMIGPLAAEEAEMAAMAASAPHMRDHDRRAYFKSLQNTQVAHRPAVEPEPREIIENDPEKAAEYLRARGLIVH